MQLKSVLWAAGICLLATLASSARAQFYLSESFNYSTGALSGKGTGTDGWTAAWAASDANSVIAAKNLEYSNGDVHVGGDGLSLRITNTANNAAISRAFTSQPGSGTIYFSFLFRGESESSDASDFLHFMLNNDTTPLDSAGIGDMDTGNAYFGTRIGDASTTMSNTTAYQPNQTYLLVGKVEDVNPGTAGSHIGIPDRITLWVNPSTFDENSPGTTWKAGPQGVPSGSAAFNHFDVFSVRTVNTDVGDAYYIDELRIGTSWAHVVPEPGSASLIALAAASLLARPRSGRRM